MGKFLRPRRGNIDEATSENITLYRGEIFLEYPEGRGVGKSPGRIIVGTGDDTYNQKEDITDDPTKYQPFITDPSIYSPIYNDSHPSDNYRYEDDDRGATLIGNMFNRYTKLPTMLGWIKKVLCRHTDNLRYDNERINALENTVIRTNILDIQTRSITIRTTSPGTTYINIDAEIDEGYEFLKWDQVVLDTNSFQSTDVILYPKNPHESSTRAYVLSGYVNTTRAYLAYYTIIKRNR